MKKILGYIITYKFSAFIALLLMFIELVVELVQPIVMATIIDEGIVNGDMRTIITWGSVLLALTIVAFIAGISSSFFAANVSQGIGHDVRRDLFEHIQFLSTQKIQKFSTSSLSTRMTNDVTQIQGFIFMAMRIMLRAPLFVVGGVVMAFTVNVNLALILLVAVPILFIIMFWIMIQGVKLFQRVQKKLDSLNSIFRENLLGIRLIKSYNRSEHENQRFNASNMSLMDDNKQALRLMEITMPVVMLGMNIAMVLIIWFGSIEISVGGAQTGEIVAIINYATRIMGSFGVFSFLIMNYSRGKASASRISEVLASPVEEAKNSESKVMSNQSEIQFDQVNYRYPGSRVNALSDLSFRVKVGDTIGIMGETGSGKSTLLKLIPRLYPVTSGRILVDGVPIDTLDSQALRKEMAMVPQESQLFSGTVFENIAWGNNNASLQEIIQAATDANLHPYIMSLPNQYETIIGQRGVNFSGGQKQRINLARAFVRNPSILLLDDSTSALDAKTEASVLNSIKSKSCTTFIVSEKISSVIEADKILLLDHGKLIDQGSHDYLLKTNTVYKEIFKSQQQQGSEL
ncbi:ATP-binding cassette domain-containing protein [Aquibacillus halophilus]|uniref:ATP-binding cassette domain-containing protein n=1 Tax=Aquibacillus halophilus TaxID=930132 RepID=A0A6A8DEV9_9BACI|nr:ABC transporter ATP-binding protein [Aquibacillus halophilus]MRH44235.1 ATP-binding cassette domain-containing protein [Aquibacillus halophilus]